MSWSPPRPFRGSLLSIDKNTKLILSGEEALTNVTPFKISLITVLKKYQYQRAAAHKKELNNKEIVKSSNKCTKHKITSSAYSRNTCVDI